MARLLGPDEAADVPTEWPIRSHEVLGEGAVSDYVDDVVATPDGAEMHRQYLLHPGAVAVIALDEADRVVVVRQYRHPVGFKLIEPPAGLLDLDNESWLVAAQRELAEETGYHAARWTRLGVVSPNPAIMDNRLHMYLADGATPTVATEFDEGELVVTFTASLAEAYAMIRRGDIDHALVVAAFAHLAIAGPAGP